MTNHNQPYSPEAIRYILDNLNVKTYNEIAEHLGRDGNAVRRKLQMMGKKKDPAFIKSGRKKRPKQEKVKSIRLPPPEPEPIQRPPAIYNNGGYLQLLAKYG